MLLFVNKKWAQIFLFKPTTHKTRNMSYTETLIFFNSDSIVSTTACRLS